jgi:hypothetical protein
MSKNARLEISKIFIELLKEKLYSGQDPIVISMKEIWSYVTYAYTTILQNFKMICEDNYGKYVSESKLCVIHKKDLYSGYGSEKVSETKTETEKKK